MGAEQSNHGNFSDSTEKLTEESMSINEELFPIENIEADKFDLLKCLDSNGTAYLIAEFDTRKIIYVNETVRRLITDVSLEETNLLQILTSAIEISDGHDQLKRTFDCALGDNAKVVPFSGKFASNLSDSEKIFFQLFLAPLHSKQGNKLLFCSIDSVSESSFETDLTCNLGYKCWACLQNKKLSEKRVEFSPLKKLSKFDATFVEGLSERNDMFCITDPDINDNPIIFVSEDFLTETGYERHEIEGKNCRFLQGADTSPEDVEHIRSAIKERKSARVCLLNYRKDGSTFINQFNLSPLFREDGTLAYFVGVQTQVENADVSPFPNQRQTLAEMINECERDQPSTSFEQNAY